MSATKRCPRQMNFILTLIFIILVSISHGQIIINAKIKNYDGKSEVRYSLTKDGIIEPYFPINTIVFPAIDGSFRIKAESNGLGMILIFFGGMTFPVFHEQKTRIDIVIDQSKIKYPKNMNSNMNRIDHITDSIRQRSIVSISGDYSEVTKFYNQTVRPRTSVTDVSGNDFSKLLFAASTPNRTKVILDSLIQLEVEQIEKLNLNLSLEPTQSLLSTKEVKDFLKNQVYSFYGSVFLNGMALKRYEQARLLLKDPKAKLTVYNPIWERLTLEFMTNVDEQVKSSSNSYEFNDLIYLLEYSKSEYRNYDLSPSTLSNDELIIEKLLKTSLLDSVKLADKKAIEAFRIQYLFRFLYTETYYSPVLLSAVNELKTLYPNSEHIAYFEHQIQKLKMYLKAAAAKYDKAKLIKTNYLKFSDLLELFHGKYVLIDIWATWCSPCINEFKYKTIFNPLVANNELAVLYISIDKESWEKKWEENIKFNQLEGFHVLANDILKEDIWNSLGGEKGIIPRYALIDKNGAVYLGDAARPSDSSKLLQQIENMLKTHP